MTRRCHKCGSTAVNEVGTELSFARGIADVPVYTLGKMSICLECGFAEYQVSKESLAQLRQGIPAHVRESGSDGRTRRI